MMMMMMMMMISTKQIDKYKISNVYLLIACVCLITNNTDTITNTDDIYSIFDL